MASAVICTLLGRVWHCCNLPCTYSLFRLISTTKSLSIYFDGVKFELFMNMMLGMPENV